MRFRRGQTSIKFSKIDIAVVSVGITMRIAKDVLAPAFVDGLLCQWHLDGAL